MWARLLFNVNKKLGSKHKYAGDELSQTEYINFSCAILNNLI